MDPEEEFIHNAMILLGSACAELAQFLAGTTPNTLPGQQATTVLAQLDHLVAGLQCLLGTYQDR